MYDNPLFRLVQCRDLSMIGRVTGAARLPTMDRCRIYHVDPWVCGETNIINQTRNIAVIPTINIFTVYTTIWYRRHFTAQKSKN